MSDTGAGSWQPDPYGRFAQRYWDGVQWTATVSDGRGGQFQDPPVPSAPGTTAPYAASTYGTTSSTSNLPVVPLAIAGAGALLVVLSLFVLTWFSVGGTDFNVSDLRDILENAEDVDSFADQYLTWGYLIAIAAVGFGFAAIFVEKLRVPAIVALVVIAGWHARTAYVLGDENVSPEFGAWLGAIGLIVVAAAVLLARSTAVLSNPRQ